MLDIGNEDLRAQLKALQYEVEFLKQERDFTAVRHEKELRDVQAKAEADFQRAQVRNLQVKPQELADGIVSRSRRVAGMSLCTKMKPSTES